MILLLALLLFGLFALLRLGLILRVRAPGDATWPQLARAFIVGMRFDSSVIAMLLTPVLLVCYLPWTSPWAGPKRRRIFIALLTLVFTIVSLISMAEYEFFNEFQSRFNQLAIRYMDHPEIVFGMVWYNYPVWKYLLAVAVLALVIYSAIRLAMRWSAPLPPPAIAVDSEAEMPGTVASESAASPASIPIRHSHGTPSQIALEIGCLVLLIGGLVTAARGGFQTEPLQWGDAFGGDNEFVSQMSLNGIWSLGHAALDSLDRDREAGGWQHAMAPAEAHRIAREMLLAPGEQPIDPDHRTALRRRGDAASATILTSADGKPINVVVVMMESFSARYCGATGAARSFTPSFDRLAAKGTLFDRAFSAGSHTHQGIFATQLGFPNLPGYETLMESPVSNQAFCSIASIFHDRGYQTMFLYNGNFAWDNMRGFFRKQGVDLFVGGDEMLGDAKYRDHVWGVSDGDLFDRCNREFEAAAAKGPFMAAVMTLSNHAPFEVPPVPGAAPITDMGEQSRRLEAMRYADYAVGKFIDDAKKLSYFKNTLFVFVGDHGFTTRPKLTQVDLLYHHVPLLFYAPQMLGTPRVDHRVASQLNVTASVLGLLDVRDAPYAGWARSLFDGTPPEDSFAVFKMSGGGRAVALAKGDDLLVIDDAKAEPQLLHYTLWPPAVTPAADADAPARRKELARQLHAYVQAALSDLTAGVAGPVQPPKKQ